MRRKLPSRLPIPRPAIVALTGFMGAGKTSVGRALADLQRWVFVDLDEVIERREALCIAEIFRQQGELGFREIETAALRNVLLEISAPTVLALGGGTFVQPANAQMLAERSVQVVFLEAPLEHLLQRCQDAGEPSEQKVRPLAADPDAFRSLYVQRLPHYRDAQLTVDTKGKSIEQLATEIASQLRLATRPPAKR